jgi:hypothetical protein
MHASVAQAAARANAQDRRSRAVATRPDAATRPLPGPPTWPSHPQPIATPSAATNRGNGSDGTTIGLGIVGSVLATVAIAGVASRNRRTKRRRVAA